MLLESTMEGDSIKLLGFFLLFKFFFTIIIVFRREVVVQNDDDNMGGVIFPVEELPKLLSNMNTKEGPFVSSIL